jgi:glycosyltransferase involved in cell wall biosynthesis
MKLLWLTTKEREAVAGRTPLLALSESLIRMGHEVTVVLASSEKGCQEGHIRYVRKRFRKLALFKLKLMVYSVWWYFSLRPDFIIVEWESAFIPILLIPLSRVGICRNNLIHDIRTIPAPSKSDHGQRIFDLCVKISKRYYLGLTTITAALKKKLCSEYNIPPTRIGIWTSGVDLNRFYPRNSSAMRRKLGVEGKFVVFYHGSLGFRRGVVEVVEAIRLLNKQYDDICLFILGSGNDLETILQLKDKHNLRNVIVHPPINYEEVPDYIAIADLCVVPLPDLECWRVSSPLKLMEYLAMGKPVVLTDIPAHKEIIKNPEDALFIPDIEPETLHQAIEKAYGMREQLGNLGIAGLRNAKENCSWDIQADSLVKFLASLTIAANEKSTEPMHVENSIRS